MPRFFPNGPGVAIEGDAAQISFGRTHANVNWACSRCHSGERHLLAAGMASWNSTEYSDAMQGSCYSQLTCITCHNPHEPIGPRWTPTADQDDARCIKCHQKYEGSDSRVAHTHHPIGSEGSRCMNCHMPRVNEGLQDVVRTHTIFSPTDRRMIEANQPNACNLCHVDRSANWTVTHLSQWYKATFPVTLLAAVRETADRPAPLDWLRNPDPAVRLVAVDALTREKALWALPQVVWTLDDPFLLNRQFARIGLEQMLGIKLLDYGYRFYMSPEERREPILRVGRALAPQATKHPAAQ
jgi:hypothetical protein